MIDNLYGSATRGAVAVLSLERLLLAAFDLRAGKVDGRITPALTAGIGLLLIEARFESNPLPETHSMTVQGTISRFEETATP